MPGPWDGSQKQSHCLGKAAWGKKPPLLSLSSRGEAPSVTQGLHTPILIPVGPPARSATSEQRQDKEPGQAGGHSPPQAPAMHSGSLGTVACPRALKAQPPPHRGWQPAGRANLQGVMGRGRGRMEGGMEAGMEGWREGWIEPLCSKPTTHPAAGPPSRGVGTAGSRRTIPFAFLPPSCPAHQAAEEHSPAQLLVELQIHAFKSLISLLSPALAVRWAFFCMRN